jgi:hypothetical protein
MRAWQSMVQAARKTKTRSTQSTMECLDVAFMLHTNTPPCKAGSGTAKSLADYNQRDDSELRSQYPSWQIADLALFALYLDC